MRKLDFYWKSNRDWWFYDKNLIPRIKNSAPQEAQESYQRYREQSKNARILPPQEIYLLGSEEESLCKNGKRQIILR